MSEHIDRARELITKANETRTEGAIGFLVLALEALCDEAEAHQHNYFGPPPGLPYRPYTTLPQRDIDDAGHKQFLKQQADKEKGTK